MSPEISAAGTTPTKGSGGAGGNSDNDGLGSLGEALAGVNLGGAAGNGGGGFSFENSEHKSGTPFNLGGNAQTNNGWGYTNGGADGVIVDGMIPGGNSQAAVQPVVTQAQPEPTTPQPAATHERKKSIDLFLSQSPSQMLGNDVFKVSTNDLPGLALTGAHAVLGNGNISASPGSFDMRGQDGGAGRSRKTESPSSAITGSGTTTSSRSGSPHDKSMSGTVGPDGGVPGGGGSRNTIQAYHAPSAAGAGGVATASPAYNNLGGPTQQQQQAPVPPQQQPQQHAPVPIPQQTVPHPTAGMPQQPPTPQQMSAQQQPHQQILYMTVPTPDGRQMLQPVQMVQLPGKQGFAYVLPPGQGGMPPMMPHPPQPGMPGADPNHAPPPMMMMPQMQPIQPQPPHAPPMGNPQNGVGAGFMNGMPPPPQNHQNKPPPPPQSMGGYGAAPSNPGGQYGIDTSLRDDYGGGGPGGSGGQYMPANGAGGASGDPNDPISSLYSTPQRPPLDALLGQVRRLSRDQVGCRLVQQALDEEGPMAATLILNEGLPFWGEAMVDPFGNYLFQKILEKITAEERVSLVKSVSPRLVNASLNLHGTRSVQKIVELCSIDEGKGYKPEGDSAADLLTKALAPAAARLCIDSHGNHVIQRILLKLSHEHSKFVFDAVAESVGDVARHRHGCCVIQRCLDSPPSPARSRLVSCIVDKSLELMQDAYGNYVVQYVLDVCADEDVHAVCESVVGKVNLLAIQKFSSNVMEKCLERCNDRTKEAYMTELSESERIRELMMDPFGNYVVQRALSVATHAQAVRLVEAMRPHLLASVPGTPNAQRNGGVRNTAGGRRIMAKICRRFPNFTLTPTGTNEELYSQNKNHHRHQHHNNNHGMIGNPYGQMQMAPTALHHPHHMNQHHPQAQHFGAPPPQPHHVNLAAHHQPYGEPQQHHQPYPNQRQPYYDMGDTTGYYQHAPHMGHGVYNPSL